MGENAYQKFLTDNTNFFEKAEEKPHVVLFCKRVTPGFRWYDAYVDLVMFFAEKTNVIIILTMHDLVDDATLKESIQLIKQSFESHRKNPAFANIQDVISVGFPVPGEFPTQCPVCSYDELTFHTKAGTQFWQCVDNPNHMSAQSKRSENFRKLLELLQLTFPEEERKVFNVIQKVDSRKKIGILVAVIGTATA